MFSTRMFEGIIFSLFVFMWLPFLVFIVAISQTKMSKKRKYIISTIFLTILLIWFLMLPYIHQITYKREHILAIERTLKGNIGALRSYIEKYYTENKEWPKKLDDANFINFMCEGTVPKEIPYATLRFDVENHKSNKVTYGTIENLNGTGGWLYDSTTGKIWVNHTANDSKGVPYSSY